MSPQRPFGEDSSTGAGEALSAGVAVFMSHVRHCGRASRALCARDASTSLPGFQPQHCQEFLSKKFWKRLMGGE